MDERFVPYAGRWVALVNDQIAGVGEHAAAAWHLARANRPKERPQLVYVDRADGDPLHLPPVMASLRPLLTHHPFPIYLVGGVVRDALLGRDCKDIDLVVPRDAIKLTFQLADKLGQPAYVLDRERDTGRIVLPELGMMIDVARFRGDDLEADLGDRDFTINAMALPANATTSASVIDPTGGMADLAASVVRHTHAQAVAQDPVRALRALRMAEVFGFEMTAETETAVCRAAPLLSRVSVERIRDELLKLLAASPAAGLQRLVDTGLLAVTLPEAAALTDVAQSPPHHEPVLAHTISVLQWLSLIINQQSFIDVPSTIPHLQSALAPYVDALHVHLLRPVDGGLDGRILLILGALFHDVGKASTQTVGEDGRIRFLGHAQAGAKLATSRLRHLCLSNKAIDHVARIVAGHMRPLLLASSQRRVSRRAVFRFFRDTKDAGLDIGLLALADHLATYNGVGETAVWERLVQLVADLYQHYFHHQETISPKLLVNGKTVITHFGLQPGPQIGYLLRQLEEAQAAGEITEVDEAMAFLQKKIKQNGFEHT
ncbi:MAG: CCA tRNA nucleotidyltransferase [Candidatus Promineifilaceae bacterium]